MDSIGNNKELDNVYLDNLQLLAARIDELASIMKLYRYDKNFDIVFYLELAHSKTLQQINELPN